MIKIKFQARLRVVKNVFTAGVIINFHECKVELFLHKRERQKLITLERREKFYSEKSHFHVNIVVSFLSLFISLRSLGGWFYVKHREDRKFGMEEEEEWRNSKKILGIQVSPNATEQRRSCDWIKSQIANSNCSFHDASWQNVATLLFLLNLPENMKCFLLLLVLSRSTACWTENRFIKFHTFHSFMTHTQFSKFFFFSWQTA